MSIEIKFKIDGDEKMFDDPVSAVNRAAYLSQQLGGTDKKIMRGVKYKHKKEFKWTSVGVINLPEPLTAQGPVAVEDDE